MSSLTSSSSSSSSTVGEKRESHDSSFSRPLLSEGDEEIVYSLPRRNRRWSFVWHLIIHLSLLAVYTTIFFAGNNWYRISECHTPLVYSPAREAIQYEKVAFNGDLEQGNRFRGKPRPELDQAWHELLEYSNIRISGETLQKLNRTSIRLADGSGDYYGAINVHHHLHCLKYVRHYLHRDYYNKTNELNEPNLEEHIDHCLDDVRQALMCNADLSIYTYDWIPDYRKPFPNFQIDHECVNWDILTDWAREHSFSIFDQKSLVHPELGLSFPLVNGKFDTNGHIHG